MEYQKILQNNREELVSSLARVIRVKSVREEACNLNGEYLPFGKGVKKCLDEVLAMGSSMGFKVKNVDNYGGHIEFTGSGEGIFGIIAHIDVVPEGTDWTHEPYGADIEDGYMYGRGTTDDKGPMIACLLAMKALKDSGFVPEKTIRLIIGCDEETAWEGIKYYFEHEARPDFGFTPDADFPCVNGEKGILIFDVAKKIGKTSQEGLELRSLKGGTAANSVAEFARAVINSPKPEQYEEIKKKIELFKLETGYKLNYKGVGKALEITATGKAAHGAHPDKGLNAISILMKFLERVSFANEDYNDFVNFYNKNIGFNLNGEGIFELSDEQSGKLVLNVGMAELKKDIAKLTINIRYPISFTDSDVFVPLQNVLDKYGIGIIKGEHKPPIYMAEDSEIIKALMAAYQNHTGDFDSKPLVIGGGTYARSTPGIVAFGALFPGDPDTMHQKDERISIDRLAEMTEIYKEAIFRLAKEKEDER